MKSNEKQILNIIKYLPVFLTLLISGILTFYLYFQNIERFKKEAENLETKYININKDLIKFQVEKIKEHILDEKNNQSIKLKKELKLQVDNAYNIAFSLYKNNLDKSKEEVKKLIKDALRDIRFNENRGYLFVYSRSGTNILHPIKINLENKNLWNYKDTKGTFLIQEMNKILEKKNSTFYTWYWTKPMDNKKELEKLGYFKLFKPFNWFIGTGEYIEDFEEELKRKVSKRLNEYRYKKNAYIFALDFDGKYISYHDKNMIGKNLRDFAYIKNYKEFLKKLIEKLEKPGFLKYKHEDKPITSMEIEKISYVDGIKDWKWVIGTGFYMDDFYKEIKEKKEKLTKINNEELKELLFISFSLTFFLLLILIYISRILESKFIKYTTEIENHINENIKKDTILAHQSKMAAMGEMIGNIAHQWRQPLSTISTITTGLRMQKEMGIKDIEFEDNSMDRINKHVQYLSETIDDFRNFFEPNKEASEFKFNELLKKVFDLVGLQYNENNIVFIKEIKDVNLFTLENELVQVLINIFNNARDSLLKVDIKNRYIFINTQIKANNFIIKIQDSGTGIDNEIIDKIFEPYFTTKEKSQGTGIGLFMSEQIIVKHLKGSMNVSNVTYKYNSKNYNGALFEIILPILKK